MGVPPEGSLEIAVTLGGQTLGKCSYATSRVLVYKNDKSDIVIRDDYGEPTRH